MFRTFNCIPNRSFYEIKLADLYHVWLTVFPRMTLIYMAKLNCVGVGKKTWHFLISEHSWIMKNLSRKGLAYTSAHRCVAL